MKGKIKKLFGFLFFISIFAFIVKLLQKIKSIIGISKSLPQYLQNILGEKPGFDLQLTLQKITITLTFSKETIEENEDIEKTVLDYIEEFYPTCGRNRFVIEIKEKDSEKSE